MQADLAHLQPARTVPVLQTGAGHVVTDSLAMAETLVEENPDVNLYPRDPAARALARSITAEMPVFADRAAGRPCSMARN